MILSSNVSVAVVLFAKKYEQRTGARVTAIRRAPQMAKAYVLAIGPNNAPSGPDIENRGMNAQTMIVVEKKSARSISVDASMIRSISGRDRSAFGAVM